MARFRFFTCYWSVEASAQMVFHSLSVEVPFDMTEKSIKLSVALLMVRPR